jgi:hypothetical protein
MTRRWFHVPYLRDDFYDSTIGKIHLFGPAEQVPIRVNETLPVSEKIGCFVVVDSVTTKIEIGLRRPKTHADETPGKPDDDD